MSAPTIESKAQELFADLGYEKTSLALIAKEAGIKKQTVYSHYKNKEELFCTIAKTVLKNEIYFISLFFSKDAPPAELVSSFAQLMKKRLRKPEDSSARFMLRLIVEAEYTEGKVFLEYSLQYQKHLEKSLASAFIRQGIQPQKANSLSMTCSAFFAGLFLFLNYEDDSIFEEHLSGSMYLWEQILKV